MEPNIHINMTAVLIAVAANFIFGYLWYTVVFGKAWATEMKFDMTQKPPASAMIKGLSFMIIGNFLMAFVFAHNMAVWNPVTWAQPASPATPWQIAGMAAFYTWLGFYLPSDLSRNAWENKSGKLFLINTVYHFLSLFIAAAVLANMS